MIQFTRWSLFGCDISCMCHASYMHTFFRCCNWFKHLFLYYSYLAYSSLANHFEQAIIQNIILLYSTQHLLFMDLSVLNSIHLLSPSFLSGFAILSISMFPCCSSISGKGIRCAQAFRCSLSFHLFCSIPPAPPWSSVQLAWSHRLSMDLHLHWLSLCQSPP